MSAYRLYGVPGSEMLHDDLGAAYETQIEPWLDESDRTPRVIEEWTVSPPSAHLPSAADHVERLIEDASESAGGEGYYDSEQHLIHDPDVLAAAEALLAALADRITYRMADRRVAEHTVTWDDEDEPLVDGERLYRPSAKPEGGAR